MQLAVAFLLVYTGALAYTGPISEPRIQAFHISREIEVCHIVVNENLTQDNVSLYILYDVKPAWDSTTSHAIAWSPSVRLEKAECRFDDSLGFFQVRAIE